MNTRRRNYNRLRLLLALVLIALLFGVFMTRMTQLSRVSEQVAAEQWVVNTNTLLMQIMVEHALRGNLNDLQRYADTNPMQLVETQTRVLPVNYAGEIDPAGAARQPRGAWFYDLQARELVYGYRDGKRQLRLRLAVNYRDRDANQIFDPGNDRVTGLHLQRSVTDGRS